MTDIAPSIRPLTAEDAPALAPLNDAAHPAVPITSADELRALLGHAALALGLERDGELVGAVVADGELDPDDVPVLRRCARVLGAYLGARDRERGDSARRRRELIARRFEDVKHEVAATASKAVRSWPVLAVAGGLAAGYAISRGGRHRVPAARHIEYVPVRSARAVEPQTRTKNVLAAILGIAATALRIGASSEARTFYNAVRRFRERRHHHQYDNHIFYTFHYLFDLFIYKYINFVKVHTRGRSNKNACK